MSVADLVPQAVRSDVSCTARGYAPGVSDIATHLLTSGTPATTQAEVEKPSYLSMQVVDKDANAVLDEIEAAVFEVAASILQVCRPSIFCGSLSMQISVTAANSPASATC